MNFEETLPDDIPLGVGREGVKPSLVLVFSYNMRGFQRNPKGKTK